MSNNIIKFTDFVTLDPSQKVAKLSKREKIKTIDNLITSAHTNGKGLVITYDLSHSGKRINNRIYSVKGQQKGIDTLTNPYNKPIILNHNAHDGEPIGRFIGGEWQNLESEYMSILKNDLSAYNSLRHAFDSDEPEHMYKSLKQFGLLQNKDWTGLGRMRVRANITDKDAIEKFLDGRYLTFSAGSSTNRHVCSICNSDWANDGPCEHRHGRDYDGETCVFVCGDFEVVEGSVVNVPADSLSQVISIHRADSLEETSKLEDSNKIEFYNTNFLFNKDSGNVQTTSNITISEDAKHTEKDTEETSEETEEVLENTDEKTFKVPAGAKGNAQQVLDWKEKHGSEVKGMTSTGWARARQLATKSEIGLSTVKRMAMFNRHRKNAEVDPKFKSEPWKDRGHVAWLGWGGTSGIDWAIKISEANNDSIQENKDDNSIIHNMENNMLKENSNTTDQLEIDWFTLDLALTALTLQEDKALSTEARNRLPDDVFCGPDKSFPIPDCAHVTAARKLIGQSKLSEVQKKSVLDCVSRKAKIMECDKSKDELELEQLRTDYNNAIAEIEKLKEKLTEVLDYISKQNITSTNDSELLQNTDNNLVVEQQNINEITEENKDDEKKSNILNKKVENPSSHIDAENINTIVKKNKLPEFEQNVVDEYFKIKEIYGIDSAEAYLFNKSPYLPRGFHPEKINNN